MVDNNEEDSSYDKSKKRADDQFRVLSEKIDHMQKTLDRTIRDLDCDRERFQEFTIRLGNVEAGLEEIRHGFKTQSRHIKDTVVDVKEAVEDAVEPVVQETKGLKKIIKHKKFVALKKGRGILGFLFFWRKRGGEN